VEMGVTMGGRSFPTSAAPQMARSPPPEPDQEGGLLRLRSRLRALTDTHVRVTLSEATSSGRRLPRGPNLRPE
jgi:hypothetical protein